MNESTPQSEPRRSNRAFFNVRNISSAIALLLVGALTISLINRGYSVPAQLQVSKPYDGLTLYRGLFFASGPAASRFPTIAKAAPYIPAEYKALEPQIIKYIQAKDPTFFDRFAKDVQSGDRVKVAAAIKNTNALQREALVAVTKNSKTSFATQVRRLNDPNPLGRKAEPDEPENDANVAVEVVVWVALFVAVFIWLVAPKTPGELKGLRYDQYVDEVVRSVPRAPAARQAMP